LPKYNSNTINLTYLLEVSSENYFSIKIADLKAFNDYKLLNIEKIALFNELSKIIIEKEMLPLGFKATKLPDKKWLIDVLNTLDPNNKLFRKPQSNIYRKVSEK